MVLWHIYRLYPPTNSYHQKVYSKLLSDAFWVCLFTSLHPLMAPSLAANSTTNFSKNSIVWSIYKQSECFCWLNSHFLAEDFMCAALSDIWFHITRCTSWTICKESMSNESRFQGFLFLVLDFPCLFLHLFITISIPNSPHVLAPSLPSNEGLPSQQILQ